MKDEGEGEGEGEDAGCRKATARLLLSHHTNGSACHLPVKRTSQE